MATYQRMAEMDRPGLRSLASELQCMSDESVASAVLQTAAAQARRAARRAATVHEALASVESES